MSTENTDQAIAELSAHIDSFDKSADPVLWAKMVHNRANMIRDTALSAQDSAGLSQARNQFLEAVAAFEAGGETMAAQQTLLNAAIAAQELGELEGDTAALSLAITECETILASDEVATNTLLKASTYNCLANALSERGPGQADSDVTILDLKNACTAYEHAIALFGQVGHEDGQVVAKQSWALTNLKFAEIIAIDGIGTVDGNGPQYYIDRAQSEPPLPPAREEVTPKKGVLGRLFGRR